MNHGFIAAGLAALSLAGSLQAAPVPDRCPFCELRYQDFDQRRIDAANYTGAYLYGSNMSWSVLRKGTFQSAVLTFARMDWSDMSDSDFSKAALEDASMSRASFRNANFNMANLNRANMARSDLSGAHFVTASMYDVRLIDARLVGAELRNANLTGADLSGARLRDADLQGAILKRADLQGSDLGGANFNGANLDDTNLTAIEIRLTNFRSASLRKALFRNAVLDAVNFQDADLSGADFTGATLRGVLLQGAILCNTKLPDGTIHLCAPLAASPAGAAKPDDERLLMKSSVNIAKSVRISVAGNLFANFQKGRPSGIFAELVAQIAHEMGQQPAFVSMPADAALKALEEGRLDVATVILKTDKIQAKFLFSAPIITDYQVVVVKRGHAFPLAHQSDLIGKRLGARQGYRYDLLGKDSALRAQLYHSDGEMVRALLLGDVDAILMSGISDVYALRSEGIMSQLEVLNASVGLVPFMFAFSKTRFTADDVTNFNQRLDTLNQQGVLRELAEKNGMGDLIDPLPALAP
jgi:uncharacterized protein YjbI with pentapeptide repeats